MKTMIKDEASAIPEDFRAIRSERELVGEVLEAISTIQWKAAGPGSGEPRPPMLATLLVYAYASGLFDSNEIAWACQADATFRYICRKDMVEPASLRHFRRLNAPGLVRALESVVARVSSQNAAWREANRRVAGGVQADSEALDE